MKKFTLRALLILLCSVTLLSCSKDGSTDELNEHDIVEYQTKYQDDLFNKLQSVIVGHWTAAQHYNADDPFAPKGWTSERLYWDQEWTFNADGTYVQKWSKDITYKGTYTLRKNPKYPTDLSQGEVFIKLQDNIFNLTKYIWLDGEYLRLGSASDGVKPSEKAGGETSIRYAKRNY